MAYQPPPGTSSLPPRPPANANNGGRSGFKPAFPSSSKPSGQTYPTTPSYNASAPPAFAGASSYGASSYSNYPGAPAPGASAGRGYTYPAASQQQAHTYGHPPTTYSASPQIRNPFPNPAQQAGIPANPSDYDPDMAYQIAQWQSAYSRDPPPVDKYGKPLPGADAPKAEPVAPSDYQPDKKKTVVRQGGGTKWTDDSLLEWDPAHLRLFVGNLAGETTDDSLLKAFATWKSVQKAKVVRDKRTNKSKGYGFVSFSDADDFFNAAKTMNGQYIQSHPVIVKKANTEIKAVNVKDKRGRYGHKNDAKKSGNPGVGGRQQGSAGHEAALGPAAHAGVVKPGQKTKNGLRLLG